MAEEGLGEVVRGVTWIGLGSMISNLGKFVYWIVVARLVDASEVGYATTAASIAGAASSLASLGLGVAVLRELPVMGARALSSALLAAVLAGCMASIFALPFSSTYPGFGPYISVAMAMIVLGILLLVVSNALIAAGLYRQVFISNVLSVATRLVVGICAVLAGFKGLGIAVSFLAAQFVMLLYSMLAVVSRVGLSAPRLGDLVEVARVGLSNYPLLLSDQLLLYASTPLVALFSGAPRAVGELYLSLMILLVVTSLPSIMASVGLPVSVRGSDVLDHALRLGGAVAIPFSVFMWAAPGLVLGVISGELAGSRVLAYLSLSTLPLVALRVAALRLTLEKKLRRLLAAGLARLAILVMASALLAPLMEGEGVALAYLLSCLAPLPLVASFLNLNTAYRLAVAQLAPLPPAILLAHHFTPPLTAIAAATLSLILVLSLGVTSVRELARLAVMVLHSLGLWREVSSTHPENQ